MSNEPPSLINLKQLNRALRQWTPNIFLIIIIGLIILILLFSIDDICDKRPKLMQFLNNYNYAETPMEATACGTKMKPTDEPPPKNITYDDTSFFNLLAFVIRKLFNESYSAAYSVIFSIHDILNRDKCCTGVIILYILFFGISKFFNEIMKSISIKNSNADKKMNKSLSAGFGIPLIEILTIITISCLIVSIVAYNVYLIHEIFNTDKYAVKLIPVYLFLLILVPLFTMIGASYLVDPDTKRRNNREQNNRSVSYNYSGYLMLFLPYLIPLFATLFVVGKTFICGFFKMIGWHLHTKIGKMLDIQEVIELVEKRNCIILYGSIFLLVTFIMIIVMHILSISAEKLNIDIVSDLINKLNNILLN
jgi:hypothetical protein